MDGSARARSRTWRDSGSISSSSAGRPASRSPKPMPSATCGAKASMNRSAIASGTGGEASSTSCPRSRSTPAAAWTPWTTSGWHSTPSALSSAIAIRSLPGGRCMVAVNGSAGRGAHVASPAS